jgi:hypothetical protein
MAEIERGRVKFFAAKETKRFGFVKVADEVGKPTGEELFFHYNAGTWPHYRGDELTFGPPARDVGGRAQAVPDPQTDDELVFMRGPGKQGDKVRVWAFASDWDSM